MPTAFDRKIAVLREAAADRFDQLTLSAFVTLRLARHRRAATEELIAERGWTGTTVEDVWQMPTILVGTHAQVRHDLDRARDRFGLSYLVTSDNDLPALAQVIAAR